MDAPARRAMARLRKATRSGAGAMIGKARELQGNAEQRFGCDQYSHGKALMAERGYGVEAQHNDSMGMEEIGCAERRL